MAASGEAEERSLQTATTVLATEQPTEPAKQRRQKGGASTTEPTGERSTTPPTTCALSRTERRPDAAKTPEATKPVATTNVTTSLANCSLGGRAETAEDPPSEAPTSATEPEKTYLKDATTKGDAAPQTREVVTATRTEIRRQPPAVAATPAQGYPQRTVGLV